MTHPEENPDVVDANDPLVFDETQAGESTDNTPDHKSAELLRLETLERHGMLTQKQDADALEELREPQNGTVDESGTEE